MNLYIFSYYYEVYLYYTINFINKLTLLYISLKMSNLTQSGQKIISRLFLYTFLVISLVSASYAVGSPNNDLSVEFFYNANSDELYVQGYAPIDARSAEIIWNSSSGVEPETTRCVGVSQGQSPEFGGLIVDTLYNPVADWTVDSYFLSAKFYNDTGCAQNEEESAAFGGEFNLLAITKLYALLTEFEAILNNTNSTLQAQIDDLQTQLISQNSSIEDLQDDVSDIVDQIVALNHGTINLRYLASVDELHVWGEAPEGATNAVVTLIDVSDGSIVYTDTAPILNNADNENRYAFNAFNSNEIDLTGLDPASYNVEVNFGSMPGNYKVGAIFVNLEIEDVLRSISILENEFDNLTIAVDDNTNEIVALWDDSNDQWVIIGNLTDDIDELEGDVATLFTQVGNLWNANSNQWTAIGNLWTANSNQWNAINNIQDDISNINDALDDLDDRVSNLAERVGALSHGTINLRYLASTAYLYVWGEAPEGAANAILKITKVSDDSLIYTDTAPILNDNNNENRYAFNAFNSNAVDVSGFDAESYNVEVTFGSLPGNYRVGDIFTNLELEEVQGSISVLFSEVDNLTIAVDDNTNEIVAIWNDSAEQWIVIDGILDDIDLIEEDISELFDEVDDLWRDSNRQWLAIGLLWVDSARQWSAIGDLDNRVTELEDIIEIINTATINLEYRNKDTNNHANTLRVWGEAPYGADQFQVILRKADRSVEYMSDRLNVGNLGDNDNTYNHRIDLNEIDYKSYNVIVRFFDDEEDRMRGYNVGDLFDELESLGFSNIFMSSRIETFFNPEVSVPLTVTLKTDESLEDAHILLKSEGGEGVVEFSQLLTTEDITGSMLMTYSVDVLFSELGIYEFYLEINGTEWRSEKFTVVVVNLPDEIPESSVLILEPAVNSPAGTYWYNWEFGPIDFEAVLFEGTKAQWCEWAIIREGQNPEDGFLGIETRTDGNDTITVCSGTIFADEKFAAEGLYELEARAQFELGVYLEDNTSLGIDGTNPEVLEITPSEGFFSGDILIEVDAVDALSGIDRVEVSIEPKSNESNTTTQGTTVYNETSGLYEIVVDTTLLDDGNYTITATAYDEAGNSHTLTVIIVVDNTAPTVEILDTNFDEMSLFEGDTVFVEVFVEDNLAGIDVVELDFEGLGTCLLMQVSGDSLSGRFETGTCNAPFFDGIVDLNETLTVTITATDNAVEANKGDNETELNLIDPILGLNETLDINETACISIDNIEGHEFGGENIVLENLCETNESALLTLGLEEDNITVNVSVDAESTVNIFTMDPFIIITQGDTEPVNATYDEETGDLSFTGDGNGTQEVIIYVGSLGAPTTVTFDGSTITSWTYSDGYVIATVTFESPHTVGLTWTTPEVLSTSSSSGGGGGGGNGGGRGYELVTEVLTENNLEVEPEFTKTIIEEDNSDSNEENEENQNTGSNQNNNNQGNNNQNDQTTQTQEPTPGLGGQATANTPTIIGIIIGLLIIGGILYFVLGRKKK